MTWWQWMIFCFGILSIAALLFLVGYVIIVSANRVRDKDIQEETEQWQSMSIWYKTVDALPPLNVKVQTMNIRNEQEIRYLEKVGAHVMVWKAYADDVGIPIDNVVMWAKRLGEIKDGDG